MFGMKEWSQRIETYTTGIPIIVRCGRVIVTNVSVFFSQSAFEFH